VKTGSRSIEKIPWEEETHCMGPTKGELPVLRGIFVIRLLPKLIGEKERTTVQQLGEKKEMPYDT